MATVRGSTGFGGSYTAALGSKVMESATSQMKSFGRGVMGAAMGQMPGIQAASSYFSQLPGNVGSFGGRGGGSGTTANMNSAAAMVKEQKQSNVISLQTVRELRGLRSDTAAQTRINQEMSRNLQKGISDVNKTMREVKEEIKKGGGNGDDDGGILDSAVNALKGIGTALGIGAGALLVSKAVSSFNRPNPKNVRAGVISAKRVADNVQRRLSKMEPAKTSTINVLYGQSTTLKERSANYLKMPFDEKGNRAVDDKNLQSGGGATLKQRFGAVAVTDTEQLKATRTQTDVTRKGLKELAIGIEKVGRNTGIAGLRENDRRRARETKIVKTPEQVIMEKAQAKFLKDLNKINADVFQDTLSKIVGNDWKKNVTQRTAAGQDYLGRTISDATGFKKGMEKTFENLLGKEYGAQYGRVFANLGEAFIQTQAQVFGKNLFSDALGSDEKARVLTGQIVGNLAKGNKQTAMEQALYGFTGQATGIETVMAQYGFANVGAGIQYTGNVLAAGTTAAVKNATGMAGDYVTIRDPVSGQKTVVRSFGGIVDLPMGAPQQQVTRSTSSASSRNAAPYTPMYSDSYSAGNYLEMPYDEKGTRAGVETTLGRDDRKVFDQTLQSNYELIDTTATGLGATAAMGGLNVQTTSEGFKADIETQGAVGQAVIESSQRNTQYLAEVISSQPRGGGSQISIGGMPGGNFGSFLVDMGASIVANKLTSGIKNPYVRAIANYGLVTGGKSAASTFLSGGGNYLGNIDTALFGSGGLSGLTTGIKSGFSGITSSLGLSSTSSSFASSMAVAPAQSTLAAGSAPIYNASYGAAGAAATPIGTTAYAASPLQATTASAGSANFVDAAYGSGVSSTNSASASAAGSGTMAVVGSTLAAISAIQQFKSGDPVGGMGSAIMAYGIYTVNPLAIGIGVGLNVLSAVFGIGRRKPPPPPNHIVHRAMMIEGNNNINAKETIYFSGSKTPDVGVLAICDEYLNIAFNTIKTFETKGIRTTPPIMWLQHAAAQRQDGKAGNMWLAVYTTEFDASNPTEKGNAALVIEFGQPKNASGSDAAKIVNELTKFYEQNSASSKLELDQAVKNLRSSAYFELAFNKARGLEDLEKIETGLFAENLAESRILADTSLARKTGKEATKVETETFERGDSENSYTETIETGRTLAYNTLTGKYDIAIADISTGMGVSTTGEIVKPETFITGKNISEAIALLTDDELLSVSGWYARQGVAWLRQNPGAWLQTSGGEQSVRKINDILRQKGYQSNLKLTSYERGDSEHSYIEYSIAGSASRMESGVTRADISDIVAFDPVANRAILDVNANKIFDETDLENYLRMNPDAASTYGTERGGIVSIAPSSNDNSTTVNNYGMGTTNAQDPFRNQRTNARPSLVSLAT